MLLDTSARRTVLPPGPRLPYLVQALGMLYRTEAFTDRCRRRYGDTYTLRIPRSPVTVWSSDPELTRLVTRLPEDVSNSTEWSAVADFLLGSYSPFLIEGKEYVQARRLVMPVLRGPRLLSSQERIAQTTREAIGNWRRDQPLRLLDLMRELVLDLLLGSVFGSVGDPVTPHIAVLTEKLRKLATSSLLLPWARHIPGSAYGQLLRVRRELADCLYATYEARSGQDSGAGFLGDLTKACAEGRLAKEALPDQLITFLLAGYATTATALASAFDLLLHHPQALARAESEAIDAARNANGPDSEGWLDAVIQETLRLRPSSWVFGRVLRQSVHFREWVLPAGAWVAFDVQDMHRRTNALTIPSTGPGSELQQFRPERYAPGAATGQRCPNSTASWYVFGGGGRVCPGSTYATFIMREVLATVLAQVRLRPLRDGPGRLAREATMLVVQDGVPVTVTDR